MYEKWLVHYIFLPLSLHDLPSSSTRSAIFFSCFFVFIGRSVLYLLDRKPTLKRCIPPSCRHLILTSCGSVCSAPVTLRPSLAVYRQTLLTQACSHPPTHMHRKEQTKSHKYALYWLGIEASPWNVESNNWGLERQHQIIPEAFWRIVSAFNNLFMRPGM